MSRTPNIAAALAVLLVSSAGAGSKPPTAEEMMIRAHAARADWHEFPGFTADVTVSDGKRSAEGRVVVRADFEIELKLSKSPGLDWAEERLRSFVSHRRPNPRRKYDVAFADENANHPQGRLIAFKGDRLHSVYRIKGDLITEVHRTIGSSRFVISILDVDRNAAGKTLPRGYNVSYWNAKTGDLVRSETFHHTWKRVGKFDLPARLLSIGSAGKGERQTREIVLRNHRLAQRK